MRHTGRVRHGLTAPRISVIVLHAGSDRQLAHCIDGLCAQDPPPQQIIIACGRAPRTLPWPAPIRVVAAESDASAAARNAGARVATEDVLAFLDGDVRVSPGWSAAIVEAFRNGATIAAGAVEAVDRPGGRSPAQLPPRRQHDLPGRQDFLPSASAINLALSRELFDRLGGFDRAVSGAEDRDLSFRAQLAGHRLTFMPEASAAASREGPLRWLRAELRFARPQPALRVRYSYFDFHDALRAWRDASWSRPARTAVRLLGEAQGWIELLGGRRPWPAAVKPASGFQERLARALPPGPSFAIVGSSPEEAASLAAAANRITDLAVPPPGLLEQALERWEQPAPWSLRMARLAARHGWGMPVGLAARRLERERPATWGDAFLALCGVFAWVARKDRFALAVSRFAQPALGERLPGLTVLPQDRLDAATRLPPALDLVRAALV
jgi:hypothetical protein